MKIIIQAKLEHLLDIKFKDSNSVELTLLNVALTTGNIDDRKPVRELLKGQFGQFFGDKGYISAALAEDLRNSGIILVTKFKKRMKNKLMTMRGFTAIT